MKRHKGVVVAIGKKKLKDMKVRIEDTYNQANGKEFLVISTHDNITLGMGMKVEFLLVSANTTSGEEIVMAGDVRPTYSEPESAKWQISRPSQSLLHSIAEEVRKMSDGQVRRAIAGIGRGGAKHQYLQQVVQRLGQKLGYASVIEKQIDGTYLSIDVALDKDGFRVGCEIPVHNIGGEVGNLKKCLTAGYDFAVSVATERTVLEKVARYARRRLSPEELLRTRFLLPEELESFLRDRGNTLSERRINGYQVQLQYKQLKPEEATIRSETIHRVITQAILRIKAQKATDPNNVF